MRVRHLPIVASAVFLAWCRFVSPPSPAWAGGAPRDTIDAGGCPGLTSVTECFVRPDAAGGASLQAAANKATISPSGRGPGEDVHVKVTVRNVLGAAVPGATVSVTVTPMSGAVFRWDDGSLPPGDTPENPQTGLTDAVGVLEVFLDEGGVALTASPVMPDLDASVVIDEPGPTPPYLGPACTTRFSVLAIDLNADGRVDLADMAIFAADYGAGDARSDFNWSGNTDLADFALFAAHYLDSLDAQ